MRKRLLSFFMMYSSILKETCVGLVVGRIFKMPVHRHFDGILRDAPYPFCLPLL